MAAVYPAALICGYGGIGRRAGFRFLCREACGFDPHYPYHKSTVILIELRWTFSMPENRLIQGFSAVSAHKRTPPQSNSAAGFRVFYGDWGFLYRRNR